MNFEREFLDSLLELEFARPTLQEEITLSRLSIYQSQFPVASFTPVQLDENLLRVVPPLFRYSNSYYFRNERRKQSKTIRVIQCSDVTDSGEFWGTTIQQARKDREKLVKGLQAVRSALSASRGRVTGDLFGEDGGEDFSACGDAVREVSETDDEGEHPNDHDGAGDGV